MKKNVLLLLIIMAVSFSACNKIQTDVDDSIFIKNPDPAALAARMTVVNQPVVWNTFKSTSAFVVPAVVEWNFASIENPNSPAHDYLSATSVEESSDYIYVGFHDRGEEFYGNLVSIGKIKDGGSGSDFRMDEIQFATIDINDIEMAGGFLWAAGESFKRGSEGLRFTVALTGSGTTEVSNISQAATLIMPISGVSANSITSIGDEVWISSGSARNGSNNGGLLVVDATSTDPSNMPFLNIKRENAKHFDAEGDYGVWLYGNGGDNSNLYLYDLSVAEGTPNRYEYVKDQTLTYGVTAFGKNAVDVWIDTDNESHPYVFCAMGKDGVIKIDLALTPTTMGVVEYTDESGMKGLANGVKTDGKYVYVAHGADGLLVYDLELNFIASWDGDFNADGNNADGSCNYVDIAESTASSATLYVAFGRGGMNKILVTY